MKHLDTLILLLILRLSCFSQGYRSFPEVDAVWSEWDIHIEGCAPNATYYFYYSYIIQTGDTTINGNTYHKLYREPYEDLYPFPDTGYRGAIRQNINLRQVYIFLRDDSIERLLFDFTVDTPGSPFPNTILKPDDSTVLSYYDSLNSDTGLYWHIPTFGYYDYAYLNYYNCSNFTYAIDEGVGGATIGSGLITKFGWFCAPGTQCYTICEGTTCLYIGDTLVIGFDDTATEHCVSLLTAGITTLPNGSHFRVTPNPVNDYIYISYNDLPAEHQYYFTVYNLLGQQVLTQPLAPASTTLPCANWQAGIYIWQVRDETGAELTEGKVVKE